MAFVDGINENLALKHVQLPPKGVSIALDRQSKCTSDSTFCPSLKTLAKSADRFQFFNNATARV